MSRAALLLLLICSLSGSALAGSSSCDIGQRWQSVPGLLSWVSSGYAGVWGSNWLFDDYYKNGTYIGSLPSTIPDDRTFGWTHGEGGGWIMLGSALLAQVDVGKDAVWGVVSSSGSVYYRSGISATNPFGTSWVAVTGLVAASVSVNDVDGKVWAVGRDGVVYRRYGMSSEVPAGVSWERVDGSGGPTTMSYVDVGGAGVWGVSTTGDVYYRTGSRTDSQGSGWQLVTGVKLSSVASGGDVVWGATSTGEVYFRLRVTATSPTGSEWIRVPAPASIKQISVSTTNNIVWAVDSGYGIYTRYP